VNTRNKNTKREGTRRDLYFHYYTYLYRYCILQVHIVYLINKKREEERRREKRGGGSKKEERRKKKEEEERRREKKKKEERRKKKEEEERRRGRKKKAATFFLSFSSSSSLPFSPRYLLGIYTNLRVYEYRGDQKKKRKEKRG
jgi:hypothetical protein